MARIVVRTIYGAALQTARNIGRPHQIESYSTINEALGDPLVVSNLPSPITRGMETVQNAYNATNDTDGLKIDLFCIGNGAHRNIAGPTGGVPYTEAIPHKASDSGLYHMIPFVVVPTANDLSSGDRAKYRMRRTVDIGGVLHAAYYGKVLDFSSTSIAKALLTTSNGVTTSTPFVPTVNNLRPTPPDLSSPTTSTLLQASATMMIPFTAAEVQMLRDACELLYGDENYAIISEIALCSSIDRSVYQKYPDSGTQTPGAGDTSLKEAIAVQANIHVSSVYPVIYANDGMNLTLNVGATEPLFGTATP